MNASVATTFLPEQLGLAERILAKSGRLEMVVGLQKVKAPPSLHHLYRFLWYWGTPGKPLLLY